MNERVGITGLLDHPLYGSAKENRDVYAALDLINDVVLEETIDKIVDSCWEIMADGRHPLIVAPAATPETSNNALAITYAQWLGNELGWEVGENIFQAKVVSRDRAGSWFRLAHNCSFYGVVEKGRAYVLVDDVMTLGGTLAALRGFIESQGGHVICMSTLSHRSGRDIRISLAESTRFGLLSRHGSAVVRLCREEFGYEMECLTEPEASVLLGCSSLDAIRKGLDGARDERIARRGSHRAS